jgi:hypothetical protein
MKSLLLSLLLVSGCATVGEYRVAATGQVTYEESVMPPSPPRGGGGPASGGQVWSYYHAPTYGVFTIKNGTTETFRGHFACVDGFEHDVEVPPFTAQQIIVPTDISRSRNGLCAFRDRL